MTATIAWQYYMQRQRPAEICRPCPSNVSATLGQIEVVVVTNGTGAPAAPGIPMVGTEDRLYRSEAEVTQTLRKEEG